MKIDGVVVLYNPDDKLLDNIDSYIKELNKLYVIDNTPDIDINDKFKKIDKIEYIPLKANKGIAYALNTGAKKAIKDKADYLLTMDQDSSFRDGEFKRMIELLQTIIDSKNVQVLTGIEADKIGVVSPYHITPRSIKELDESKGVEFPLEVMTSGNLVNLKAYEKVGGFKDWMFIDCVDFDFCFNLQKHDYMVIRLNDIKMDHELGDTKPVQFLWKKTFTDNHSPMRWYYMSRNRLYIYQMYHDDYPLYCDELLRCTKRELRKIWVFEDNKIAKTKAILKGKRDFKKGIKGATYEK